MTSNARPKPCPLPLDQLADRSVQDAMRHLDSLGVPVATAVSHDESGHATAALILIVGNQTDDCLAALGPYLKVASVK